jgi:small conductance mechanosensitive channel
MNEALASTTTDVGGLAMLAWTWTIAFAPRLIAALVIVVGGLLVSHWLRRAIIGVTNRSQRLDPTLRPVLLAVVQYAIFILMLLLVLNQLGIQTTSLLAVLGAAGLAVGLALQGTLSNIAAGIMLLWLRPFKLGDYIEVNVNLNGIVEETGLFACTLRTYDGMRVFAPNSTLWNVAMRNHTRVARRMLAVSVTVNGDGEGAPRAAMERAMQANGEVLASPPPAIFLDQMTNTTATLTCRFWTSHAHYGATQRSIVTTLRTRLLEAGVKPEDIQKIERVTPSPTDPTRLIDL